MWELTIFLSLIVSAWALFKGRLTISKSLYLEGKQAHIFGLTLIFSNFTAYPLVYALIYNSLPKQLTQHDIKLTIFNWLFFAAHMLIVAKFAMMFKNTSKKKSQKGKK